MIQRTHTGRNSALDIHDRFYAMMSELDPVLMELADHADGDGQAEEQIIGALDAAIEQLWAYLEQPGRRGSEIVPPVPPGLEKLDGDDHFPMDRFKRLLVRFIRSAFDDDSLNEYNADIMVSIGDGDGCSVYKKVVYWHNGDGRDDDDLPSIDIELPPEPPHSSNGERRKAAEVSRKPSASDNG